MPKIISTSLKFPLVLILLICGLLSACSNGVLLSKNDKAQPPFNRLAEMSWQLSSIKRGQSRPVSLIAEGIPLKRYRLDFADDRMQLRGGCNAINGAVKITAPGKMQIGPMVMTNRGCNTKLMKADSEIGRTLAYVTHYRLDGRSLLMLGAKRILLFEGTPKTAGNISNPNLRKANFW